MTKRTQQFPFPVSKAPLPDVVEDSAPWVAKETATCDFQDARLSRRLRAHLGQLANGVGAPIPFACQVPKFRPLQTTGRSMEKPHCCRDVQNFLNQLNFLSWGESLLDDAPDYWTSSGDQRDLATLF
jgi:hypothetical protein